ncbi:MAG: hypothetical protein F4Z70_13685, partial [Acidimicrobiia bacterium]|nr:hypothetical protein [Acidimicrobiia bacterium]
MHQWKAWAVIAVIAAAVGVVAVVVDRQFLVEEDPVLTTSPAPIAPSPVSTPASTAPPSPD